MKFELGKFYEHSGGGKLYMCGLANTKVYGLGLVAESPEGVYSIVGLDEVNAKNWQEINEKEYMRTKRIYYND